MTSRQKPSLVRIVLSSVSVHCCDSPPLQARIATVLAFTCRLLALSIHFWLSLPLMGPVRVAAWLASMKAAPITANSTTNTTGLLTLRPKKAGSLALLDFDTDFRELDALDFALVFGFIAAFLVLAIYLSFCSILWINVPAFYFLLLSISI